MKQELKTIKVKKETIQNLNFISAVIDKKQYEVVDILAKKERVRISKTKQ